MILKKEIIIIAKEFKRFDLLINNLLNFSFDEINQIIKDYNVVVDEKIKIRNSSFVVKPNQIIKITKKENKNNKKDLLLAQEIPLDIIFEDEHIIVLNKPSGMSTHPCSKEDNNSLLNALYFHLQNSFDLNGKLEPKIVHRLDKHTSGLMIVAKTKEASRYFFKLLKEHKIKREYIALVDGIINKPLIIQKSLCKDNLCPFLKMKICNCKNSKKAYTKIIPFYNFPTFTIVKCLLKTGRTHQIRIHLQSINHPILGDDLYGKYIDEYKQRLFAYKISFTHINGQFLSFEIDYPNDFFKNILKKD